MRQGNSSELAAVDQAYDDPFCYRCIIICATQLVGNPCQSMAVFFLHSSSSILWGKTELNPAFIICLMLPLCWSQFSSFGESLSLLWGPFILLLLHLKFHILSLAQSETCCRNHQPHRQPATDSHSFPSGWGWSDSFIFLHCTKTQIILQKDYSHTLQVYLTYSREPTKLFSKDWL